MKIGCLLLALSMIICMVGCGNGSSENGGNILPTKESLDETKVVESVVNSYFEKLCSGEFEASQEYLDKEYDYVEKAIYGINCNTEDVLKKLYSKYQITIDSSEVEDTTAIVNIVITCPSVRELLTENTKAISLLRMDENAQAKAVDEKLDEEGLEYQTNTASLYLKKKQNNWEIVTGDAFTQVLNYGASAAWTMDSVTENERKIEEKNQYIKENIVLVDYLVCECQKYSDTKVPGIKNISIKNNGNKDISQLSLNLEFLADDGSVIDTKEVSIIGLFDSNIKAGYSWKIEDDEFVEIENIPDNVNLEKVNVSIGDVKLREPDTSSGILSEEEQYIIQYLELTDAKVSMCQGYSGIVPGLSRVAVKNNGERNIKYLTVTVFFQDESGKNIAEDSFMVIGSLFGGDTLKANYSWKMEDDKFYQIENLADEVELARHTVEITEIEFE